LVLALGFTHHNFDVDGLVVQGSGILHLDHVHGMAKGRELRLCNALGVFVAVLDVQIVPNLAAFVLAINDFVGQLKASAVARL
jgi:hypothetical protein